MAFIRRGRFPYPIRGAVFLRQDERVVPRRGFGIGLNQRGFDDAKRSRTARDQKGIRPFRLHQRVFRHRGGIRHVNPFVLDLGLLQLPVNTGQNLGIPRFVRQVAIVHISIKRNAILVADQSEADLLLPTMMPIVAMGNLQAIGRIRFVRAVNGFIRRIGVEHLQRKTFFPIDMNQAGADDLENIRLIQAIQMARQRVIIEPGRLKSGPDQLRQIDLLRPSFQVNKCLPAVKGIVDDGLNGIARPGLTLGIDRNEMVNQPGEV